MKLHALLTRGLRETAAFWPDIDVAFSWVKQAAQVLTNAVGLTAAEVRQQLAGLLGAMSRWQTRRARWRRRLNTSWR